MILTEIIFALSGCRSQDMQDLSVAPKQEDIYSFGDANPSSATYQETYIFKIKTSDSPLPYTISVNEN